MRPTARAYFPSKPSRQAGRRLRQRDVWATQSASHSADAIRSPGRAFLVSRFLVVCGRSFSRHGQRSPEKHTVGPDSWHDRRDSRFARLKRSYERAGLLGGPASPAPDSTGSTYCAMVQRSLPMALTRFADLWDLATA